MRRRFHLYSRLYDTSEVGLYLEQAARHEARLMLLSVADTPETLSLLHAYAGKILFSSSPSISMSPGHST